MKSVELADVLRRHPLAYLLAVGDDPRAHVCAVTARVVGDLVVITGAGSGTRTRIGGNPAVTLLAPPAEPGGHSLIVDGTAALAADAVHVAPSRAVLHRPAPDPAPAAGTPADGCAQDCVELAAEAPAASTPRTVSRGTP